uniref:Uncharacterized protein n=1 Tax=Lotus japonicus TaxID=34305 RepID=I3ST32_LOTJA|nr:unknown [Lotus japonicus]
MEGQGRALRDSSASTGLKINDDKSGSGSELEEAMYEDPPRRDCRAPSRNSFLNIDNVEPGPPFLTLLLRCTFKKLPCCVVRCVTRSIPTFFAQTGHTPVLAWRGCCSSMWQQSETTS